MKNLLYKVSVLCLLAAVFAGCAPKEEYMGGIGDFDLTLKEAGPNYAEFYVTAPSAVEMAYVVGTEAQNTTAPLLFMTGETMEVNPKDVIRIEGDLQANTGYILYAAAKLDAMTYSKVINVTFKTKGYKFNELLTVVDRSYDGFKVHITVPKETKKRGNVIRYTGSNMAIYNLLKSNYGDEGHMILEGVVANGNRYGNYAKNDSTIIRNGYTTVETDEDGNVIYDENGDTYDVHDPITPGETYVFYAGECALGTDEEMGAITGWYYGTANTLTYQVPLYSRDAVDPDFDWDLPGRTDWTGSGWYGAFQKIVFKVKDPEKSDKTVNVRIPEDERSVINAKVYFDMDEGVSRYFYMILDDATYNGIVDQYLGKRGAPEEEINAAFQWFLTSYLAFQTWGVGNEVESMQVDAAASFNDGVLIGGETYHVVCTVLVDGEVFPDAEGNMTGDGAYQDYIHVEFQAKEKTLSPPVIQVKALNSGDPYLAKFNIKAVNQDVAGPLAGAYYAANYSREFQLMENMGYSYADLAQMNSVFSADEIEAVNSDEGFDLYIPTLDGETIRFVVYGCNEEFTFNYIDRDNEGMGWDDCVVDMAPKDNPVDSPLLTTLAGDWKISARIRVNEEIDGEVLTNTQKWTSSVTISDKIMNLPEVVEDFVYDLYLDTELEEGDDKYEDEVEANKTNVDSMFEEMLELSERFSEYRVKGQNRLLCTGFFDYDSYEEERRLSYRNPYDLFKATDYSSVDVPQIINDFGPKWYLEVLEDGRVIVPFSYETLPPMSAWPGTVFYVGGVGENGAFYESTETYPGFPVDVSKDGNVITIKPIVLSDEAGNSYPYYMNALGISDESTGTMELIYTVVSDIVLTRQNAKTRSTDETSSMPHNLVPSHVNPITVDGDAAALPERRIHKSMSEFEHKPKKVYKVDETPNVVTMEMLNEGTKKILDKYTVKK